MFTLIVSYNHFPTKASRLSNDPQMSGYQKRAGHNSTRFQNSITFSIHRERQQFGSTFPFKCIIFRYSCTVFCKIQDGDGWIGRLLQA